MKSDHAHLQMVNIADVIALFRMSKSTLWRHIKEGKFPEPIYIGRAPLWPLATLEGFLGEKMGRKHEIDELA